MVLPGGFSYGDYLRGGAIARFAPVMTSVVERPGAGCRCSASATASRCCARRACCRGRSPATRTCTSSAATSGCASRAPTAWTSGLSAGHEVVVPVKNGEGRFVAEPAVSTARGRGPGRRPLPGQQPQRRARDVAGIRNAAGNVVGMMPHPEHAVEDLTGPSTDGLVLFTSVLRSLVAA